MKKLTVGSCFSGIGGLELGLEWTNGFETKWQIENDEYASAVLAKHWPDVKRYGDISQANDEGAFENVDVVVGGFPCTDISLAGKGAGIDGQHSGLWREMYRTIQLVRPKYAIMENVAALLGRGMDRVLGDLAQGGYDAEWDCISAQSVGAPHIRSRVFIIAYPARKQDRRIFQPWFQPYTGTGSEKEMAHAESGGWDEGSTYTRRSGEGKAAEKERSGSTVRSWWETEPPICRMVDGVSNRPHRLKCLGNAVVPQVAQKIGEMIIEFERSR